VFFLLSNFSAYFSFPIFGLWGDGVQKFRSFNTLRKNNAMERLHKISESDILFLDIETVPQESSYDMLSEAVRALWDRKSMLWIKDKETGKEHYQKAGIYAEFGKIVCISVGVMFYKDSQRHIRIKSFAGDDEYQLLQDFADMCNRSFGAPQHHLCAHNGKEFDYPYIARRMLIHRITLPMLFDLAGKKPWEVKHLDTMELWKFGDYKSYTSLNLLTNVFGIPTPKDDIDGSQVAHVYYQEHDLPRIANYCQKDVLALAQVFLCYKGEALIEALNVEFATIH
jgi:uncharacterized protein YprB with RNaseH-like and TPR domain